MLREAQKETCGRAGQKEGWSKSPTQQSFQDHGLSEKFSFVKDTRTAWWHSSHEQSPQVNADPNVEFEHGAHAVSHAWMHWVHSSEA